MPSTVAVESYPSISVLLNNESLSIHSQDDPVAMTFEFHLDSFFLHTLESFDLSLQVTPCMLMLSLPSARHFLLSWFSVGVPTPSRDANEPSDLSFGPITPSCGEVISGEVIRHGDVPWV